MRKLILQEWVTVDGYAADRNGGLDFFSDPSLNKYSDDDILQFMNSIDTILLGANTYKLFVDYWPEATNDKEVMADRLNEMPKIVFSKTLQRAPWGKWPDAKVIAADASETVRKLKHQEGKDMVLWGSLSVAQALMKEHLIDEYHIRICATALGAGRPLFDDTGELKLELMDTKIYQSGLVFLQYRDMDAV